MRDLYETNASFQQVDTKAHVHLQKSSDPEHLMTLFL